VFRRNPLNQLAKEEYAQARGTAHKQLLQQARWQLQLLCNQAEQALQTSISESKSLEKQRKNRLRQALSYHLINTRLTEIPGVGDKRKEQILEFLYITRLSDLHHAYQVPGIGEQTQQAISQWVKRYRKQVPKLLKQDFPGKADIEAEFKELMIIKQRQLKGKERRLQNLESKRNRLDQELNWLEPIQEKHFRKALSSPNDPYPELDRYLQGVFAEWESIPNWFQEAIKLAHETDAQKQQQKSQRNENPLWRIFDLYDNE